MGAEVGHCGWDTGSPTIEDTGPIKGQAWEEIPKILPMGTQSPSWEAVTSTGTAGGESGGRESISSHKQPPHPGWSPTALSAVLIYS